MQNAMQMLKERAELRAADFDWAKEMQRQANAQSFAERAAAAKREMANA